MRKHPSLDSEILKVTEGSLSKVHRSVQKRFLRSIKEGKNDAELRYIVTTLNELNMNGEVDLHDLGAEIGVLGARKKDSQEYKEFVACYNSAARNVKRILTLI